MKLLTVFGEGLALLVLAQASWAHESVAQQRLDQRLVVAVSAAHPNYQAIGAALKAGADPSARDEWGEPVLTIAVGSASLSTVNLLLDHGADIYAVDAKGDSAASVAAFNGRIPILKALLAKGAKVESKDLIGWTPLVFAVIGGSPDGAVPLLLSRGASVDVSGLVQTAIDTGHYSTVRAILDAGASADGGDLIKAAAVGRVDMVRLLLAHNAPVDGYKRHPFLDVQPLSGEPLRPYDRFGPGTPLIAAAAHGYLPVVQVLVGAGADVNLLGPNGETAYFVAKSRNHDDVARFLVDHGADPNVHPNEIPAPRTWLVPAGGDHTTSADRI